MYGAILGDMIGAPFEFDRGDKTKDFPLFSAQSQFTDDTVMLIAVAEALMDAKEKANSAITTSACGTDASATITSAGSADASEISTSADAASKGGIALNSGILTPTPEDIKSALVSSMQRWGRQYPNAGYGLRFNRWLYARDPQPYNSFGNGSAMRVPAVGWLYDTLEETRTMARLMAEVTHNHPEGIKGAEATASAIYLARTGRSKNEIKDYIVREFGYDLSRTCDEIRPTYHHVESCQETVPEAMTAFLEGQDFEDVIRTAVSLGGDCDTLTCIAGGIAEAFYGVPEHLVAICKSRLSKDIQNVINRMDAMLTG